MMIDKMIRVYPPKNPFPLSADDARIVARIDDESEYREMLNRAKVGAK